MAKRKSNSIKSKLKKIRKKLKINNETLIIGAILLALALFFLITQGFKIMLVLMTGICIILGIARILDKTKKKSKRKKILNFILIGVFSLAIISCLAVVGFILLVVIKAPKFDINKLNKREASIIYDKDGTEITRLGTELRENVTYDDLPEVFIDALIATEDSRFFQHNGLDAPRFAKATMGQLMGNSDAGGASTLSMQLIKNTYTSKKSRGLEGIIRKFTDIYLAVFKLEKNFSKKEIMEYYVNNYELGSNAWGVEQASQTYFGKSVRELNLSEAALLVGIFNNPTAYNPFYHPVAATNRRTTVLNLMIRHGYITQEEADIANSIPVQSLLANKTKALKYQSYIDTVIEELINKYNINPYNTSVLIYTNMDRNRQAGIDEVLNGNTKYKWINDKVQSGVAIVDVNTGKIVAIGAGRNKTTARSWNFATQETNQIGSTAKPIFDYGPAIEYLNYSTYEQVLDEPWSYTGGQNVNNSDRKYNGWMTIRTAIADSRNVPALKTFQQVQSQVGNKKIAEFVSNLGLTPETDADGKVYESSSIGAVDGITVLQMAAAYAAFANGGTYIEPLSINKIVYRDTNKTIEADPVTRKVMQESTAFMITDMLITAVNSGLSNGARMNGVTMAAKTGTSNFSNETIKYYKMKGNPINDSWIVGYDPEYCMAMWYGYQNASSEYYLELNSAGIERGKLYRAYGAAIFNKNSGKTFKQPSNVVKVGVEKGSNPAALPSPNTPETGITYEYFIKGTEPTEVSSAYTKLSKVSNLKVNYDENTSKINISWSKQNAPVENTTFGEFGYKVYYGDILLGFTTENSYSIEASSNIEGTYKVVTCFEKFEGNQSEPAMYTIGIGNDNDTYSMILNGDNPVTITATEKFTDLAKPITFKINDVETEVPFATTIKDPDGKIISEINGSLTNQLKTGTYTIDYTVSYNGKTYTKTRKVNVI